MNPAQIQTIEDLQFYLANALQLEHATTPPYLTAMYSIVPGSNSAARRIIRTVAVEEMLHMAHVANLLNAIGGTPNLLEDDFVPDYPTYLPDGDRDFQVSLQRFSPAAIKNFLQIEQPTEDESNANREANCKLDRPATALLQVSKDQPRLQFDSIGAFYAEIRRGFDFLYEQFGAAIFQGNINSQVTAQYYYSGGGELFPVTNIESAREAVRVIAEQGEGYGGTILTKEGELAHYYRFQQLELRRLYRKGDKPDCPTGGFIDVNYDAVYPIKTNARLEDYPAKSELYAAAIDFAEDYQAFLKTITEAFTGEPAKLQEAVGRMFQIKAKALALIRNPIPDVAGVNAMPIFKLAKEPAEA